ncbi:YtxH domain-containing protein [Hymenobacter sp. HSC-4F20]|uniref:YtxH domain-containing protein n=1 Tax=Hymenobacter sp. HSC-4F20 TaxID=2864135 RepID=UPI001C73BA36|nr:YtxH domain-containing protein [Hymenobacter sp. HSC-4F20]MBX0292048.1 YtxH domain-containing protein [Hymenobacter sp. HSC-4F20]
MEDTKGKVILSLLVGATAGAVAGLLLAPETGDATRANLKKSASKWGDDLAKLLKQGKAGLGSLKTDEVDSEQIRTDRTAADTLLNSLSDSAYEVSTSSDADSDYDGVGGDSRHYPGYKS